MLEENVKLVNEIVEEEETQRKKQEDDQSKSMPGNFDANSLMRNAQSMSGNFSPPSF